MFRKPKRKLKQSLRKKDEENGPIGGLATEQNANEEQEEEETGGSTTELLEEARKRLKQQNNKEEGAGSQSKKSLMHTFDASNGKDLNKATDLVTSTASHHPDRVAADTQEAGRGADGMFRQGRNKFWAGPIKAATNVRVTTRFDYQPDVCKDYKETGFCGFGDTCIYLHDRGDTMAGWQLEQKWEEEQRMKKEKEQKDLDEFLSGGKSAATGDATVTEDGLPFACHLCRNAFTDPVVTSCQHYFCEKCIMSHVRNHSDACPICQKETHRVFNEPTKLLAKKKQVLGRREASEEGSWKAFFDKLTGSE
jgi:RING finger protein 113A